MFGKKNIAKSIRKGNLDEVKQILAEKPELLEQKFSTWKSTDSLLYIAAVYNQLDIVKYLVTEMGMDVDVRNEMNATPLHCTVEAGEFEATSLLLDLGADPLAEWKYGDVKSLAQQRSQKFRDLIDAACDKKLELEKAAAVEKEILEHEKRVEGI